MLIAELAERVVVHSDAVGTIPARRDLLPSKPFCHMSVYILYFMLNFKTTAILRYCLC